VVVPPEAPVAEDDAPALQDASQAPGLDAMALDELDDDATAPTDGFEGESAPDAAEETAFDVDNLGVPDWAKEGGDEDAAAPDVAEDADTIAEEAPQHVAAPPQPAAPVAADLTALTETLMAAQRDAAERLEERLSSVAAGIMALSTSNETSERLDALAASGDTRLALVSALSREVGAGLSSLEAGQTALREALEGMGGDANSSVAEALGALQARTETLSHAVDAAAGAVDEAAEAAAATVLAATQDRAAEDEARLQALCDRIAGMTGDGDALGALSAQVDGLKSRVAEMADLAASHRDALVRLEDAVAPDRLRLALDGAAERTETATARRAASRIVDMPSMDIPPRPAKTAAGE
jgi:hypothetical protein